MHVYKCKLLCLKMKINFIGIIMSYEKKKLNFVRNLISINFTVFTQLLGSFWP